MNAAPHARPGLPVPVFTLGSALRWLGHRCFQRCSASLEELSASVSFTPLGDTLRPAPHGTLVGVDLAGGANPGVDLRVPFGIVQECAAKDGITVHAAQGPDNAPHLAAIDPDPHRDAVSGRIDSITSLSDNRGGNPVADLRTVGGVAHPGGGPHLPQSTTGQSTGAVREARQSDPSTHFAPGDPGESALFGVTEGSPCGLAPFGEFDRAGLDLWNASATRLLERQCGAVSIDFTDLMFIDAAGMGAIIDLGNALAERRNHMTLRAPIRNVRRSFTAAGLTHLMPE